MWEGGDWRHAHHFYYYGLTDSHCDGEMGGGKGLMLSIQAHELLQYHSPSHVHSPFHVMIEYYLHPN